MSSSEWLGLLAEPDAVAGNPARWQLEQLHGRVQAPSQVQALGGLVFSMR
jgi:hypothetical protein